jgi:hypothetical protein
MNIRANTLVDVFEYTDDEGEPVSTGEPFDPYDNWWRRRRADVPCYAEKLSSALRDFIFGDRQGDFWRLFFDRGLLEDTGRPDTDFTRRWLVRKFAAPTSPDTMCWLVDFAPAVYDDPLKHIECYVNVLDPEPSNRD